MEKTAVVNHRVPEDLKRAFEDACKRNDQTGSQVIRALMREYVRKNFQGELDLGAKPKKRCTCTITEFERQESPTCPVHGSRK